MAQAPDLVLLKDTDGDDRADVRERVISGLDSADGSRAASASKAEQPITCGFEPFVAKPGVVTSLEQVNALREAEGI